MDTWEYILKEEEEEKKEEEVKGDKEEEEEQERRKRETIKPVLLSGLWREISGVVCLTNQTLYEKPKV